MPESEGARAQSLTRGANSSNATASVAPSMWKEATEGPSRSRKWATYTRAHCRAPPVGVAIYLSHLYKRWAAIRVVQSAARHPPNLG